MCRGARRRSLNGVRMMKGEKLNLLTVLTVLTVSPELLTGFAAQATPHPACR